MTDYDTFYDEIKESSGNLRVTIPKKVAEIAGYKEGDKIKILIQKVE